MIFANYKKNTQHLHRAQLAVHKAQIKLHKNLIQSLYWACGKSTLHKEQVKMAGLWLVYALSVINTMG